MRKISAFGSHCKGSHSLGRPLLQTDARKSKTSCGINAISLDCRTQQRSDKDTTEVVLFYENVPLRPVDMKSEFSTTSQALWVYDKKIKCWFAGSLKNQQGKNFKTYQEIPKTRISVSFALLLISPRLMR